MPRRATIPDDGPNALPSESREAEVASACWLVGAQTRISVEAPVLLGRGPYNHVVLDDARVSWQHARVIPHEDGLLVHDLNSTNGTTVNGARVTREHLGPGDVLGVGRFTFRIERAPVTGERPPETGRTRNLETEAKLRVADAVNLDGVDVDLAADDAAPVSTIETPHLDLRQLEDAHTKLGVLYSFVQAISQSNDTRELVELMSRRVLAVFPLARAVRVYLREPVGDGYEFLLSHVDGLAEAGPLRLAADVHRRLLEARRSVAEPFESEGGESCVWSPMIDHGELVGVLQVVVSPLPSRAGLDLLDGMASPAAILLQNARMRETRAKRDRLEHDLELAAEIQRSFLPREVIAVEGLDLLVEYRSAYAVGGDFYDVFWVAPGRLGVFVGDISGKGVSAALHMARISSELRAAALTLIRPQAVFRALNEGVLARQQPELFFTAVYFTLDVETGEIILANAGHPPPYVRHADGSIAAVLGGASGAVGIFEDATFAETRLVLEPGDGLVIYTDGVTEALDHRGALFGQDRLESALAAAPSRAGGLVDHVLASLDRHARGVHVNDDLTLFVCQRQMDKHRSLQPRRRGSGSLASPSVPPAPPTPRRI